MTELPFLPGWYPVLRLNRLRRAPQPLVLAGTRLIAQRCADSTVRLTDTLTDAPWPCAEAGGYLYAALGEGAGAFLPPGPALPVPHSTTFVDGEVRARLADIAENILDTTHTSVVHKGYLRRASERRPIEAQTASGPGWIAVTYPPGAAPGGWGARLIGAHRYTIRDSFRAPGVAEVLYTDQSRDVFAARFSLTPRREEQTYLAGAISVPGKGPVAALKLAALRLFFLRIFAEDRAILELIGANRNCHGNAPIVYTPQDLLRPGIDAILTGREPLAPPARISLKV